MLDGADQGRFDRLRYVEIKHGRKFDMSIHDIFVVQPPLTVLANGTYLSLTILIFDLALQYYIYLIGIAMMAVLGHIHTTFGARIPGNISLDGKTFASIKTGIAGLKDIPTAGLLQIVAFIGFLELFVMKDKGKGAFPGDLRNGMFSWSGSEEELMQKRAIELNNGRAAQMGILGLMVHEMLDGEPYVINALFGNPSNFNAGL
jgi:hypothetical protein